MSILDSSLGSCGTITNANITHTLICARNFTHDDDDDDSDSDSDSDDATSTLK